MFAKIRYIILLSLIAIAVSFTACKKDPALISSTSSRVKSETTTSPSGIAYTVSHTYDSSGRQITSQTDTVVTTYTYGADTITKTISLAGHYFITGYTANQWGRVVSDSKFYHYAYDGNAYLVNYSYTGYGNYDSTVYTISGGNVSTSVEHQADSATSNVITTSNTYLSNADTRDYGMAAFGKPNANLLNTQTITQVLNGSTIVSNYTYTYTYDAQGRVAQQVKSSGSSVYTTTYTYY